MSDGRTGTGPVPRGDGERSLSKYARYCVAVAEMRAAHPEYRRGQAHFNVLYFGGFDPEYADQIRGTDLDPFYRDAVVSRLLEGLVQRWSGE